MNESASHVMTDTQLSYFRKVSNLPSQIWQQRNSSYFIVAPPPSQVGLTDIKSITERWQRFPPHIPIEMDYFHTAAVPSSSRSYEPFKYYMKLKTLVTDIIETRRHSRFICGSILGFDITGTGSLQRPLLNWTLLHVASQ